MPPSVPVPAARESATAVSAPTAEALPYASRASSATGNANPAVGIVPPFTVIAIFDGDAGETVTGTPVPFEWLPSSTVSEAAPER